METPTVEISKDKTSEEIAKIMGDLLRESVFVYVSDTDRTTFIMAVLGAMKAEYKVRADVFLLVFAKGFTAEFADGVRTEIADLWKDISDAAKAKDPVEWDDPKNPKKARWIRIQLDATGNTIKVLRDFIVH